MSSITSDNAKQYSDSRKLAARGRLNNEYTIAEVGWFPWVAGQLPLNAGASVLDLGCGPGWFWAATANGLPENLSLTLSDLSAGMVQEAVERCQKLPFALVAGQHADAAALPFEDGSFDTVIAMHVFYHLPDQAKGMAEIYRVLKPGGYLAVTTNGRNHLRKVHELTTVLGGPPCDPGGAAFGFEKAERLMQDQFGNVTMTRHQSRLRVTEPEDLFLALTSYPPGDQASEAQLASFRNVIHAAFQAGGDAIEAEKEVGLFISRKVD